MGSRTIRCSHCGSAVTLDALDPAAYCPFCGKALELDGLRDELDRYSSAVGAGMQQVEQEQQHADAWDRMYGGAKGPAKTMGLAYGLMIGVPLLLSLGVFLLHRSCSLDVRGPGLSFVIMGASYGGAIVFFIWYYRRRRKRSGAVQPAASAATVACPNCGAPGVLTPGQAADTCEYCGGALVASQTVMQRSLDQVQAAARAAQMERYRKQRQGMAHLMSYSTGSTRLLPYIGMAPFLLMVLVLPFGWTYSMIWGDSPFHPGVFLAYGLVFGGVGGGIIFLRRRIGRRRALTAALEALARQHGGRVLSGLNDWVAWLNAYWADEYGAQQIYQGPLAGAAMLQAEGYPVLVIADAAGQDRYRPPRLHILLAAWVPGVSDAQDVTDAALDAGAEQTRRDLRQRGFHARVRRGGVEAHALEGTLAELAAEPATLRELAPVITAMAHLADAAGATPVQPL